MDGLDVHCKIMQFISAKPLIEKYRNGSCQEAEVAPYFMAYVILMALVTGFAFGEMSGWSVASGVASIVITITGVLHLKKQNGDTFGNGFLSKYFSLGWVITFRMLVMAIPAAVVIFALASIVGGDDAIEPAGAIFTIAIEILFYWWLGTLIAETNNYQSEQASAGNPGSAPSPMMTGNTTFNPQSKAHRRSGVHGFSRL